MRISRIVPGMGEEALAVLRAGTYFGEMALIDDFPRSADARAHEECRLFVIRKEDLEDLLFVDRDLAYELLVELRAHARRPPARDQRQDDVPGRHQQVLEARFARSREGWALPRTTPSPQGEPARRSRASWLEYRRSRRRGPARLRAGAGGRVAVVGGAVGAAAFGAGAGAVAGLGVLRLLLGRAGGRRAGGAGRIVAAGPGAVAGPVLAAGRGVGRQAAVVRLGERPALTSAQVPAKPATLHAWQSGQLDDPQQTPSTQLPLSHWLPAAQLPPRPISCTPSRGS